MSIGVDGWKRRRISHHHFLMVMRYFPPPPPPPTCLFLPHPHLLFLLLFFLSCLFLLLCLSTVNQESAEQERRLGIGATAATLETPRDEEPACQRWRSDTSDSSILSDSPPNPTPPLPHTTITQKDKKKNLAKTGVLQVVVLNLFFLTGLIYFGLSFFSVSSHQGRRNKKKAGRVSGVSDKEERIDGMRTTSRHLLWRTTKILTHFSNPTIPCSRSVPGTPFMPPSLLSQSLCDHPPPPFPPIPTTSLLLFLHSSIKSLIPFFARLLMTAEAQTSPGCFLLRLCDRGIIAARA